MCGIVCALDIKQKVEILRPKVLEMSKKVRHRGPDWSGIHCGDNVLLAHERLAIVDPQSGNQPIYSSDNKLILAANGEIYNHRKLKDKLNIKYNCYEYKNFTYNKEIFHDYFLQKNCKATESQKTSALYKVFTDQDGYRFAGKKRLPRKNNLVFIGDSTTFGMSSKGFYSKEEKKEKKKEN